jgi:fatty-acyl-CoA synthase
MLADHPSAGEGSPQKISVMTGGAPPTPALLEQLARLNIEVVHLYGLTETFGPAAICDWRPEWNELPAPEQARMKARQGVENVISQPLRVVDAAGADVPLDGSTIGEITITGNNLMAGYYLDEEATRRAIPDGWFRTGDLAVMHTDGYVEIVDRAKDIIISGGENISSLEVERVLARHPAVYEAAVVGVPDAKWGEAVTAVVELRPGAEVSESELIEYVKSQLARYKAPKRVAFEQLPRTSTGKIQKHRLRADLSGDSAISTSGPEGLDAPGVHWA